MTTKRCKTASKRHKDIKRLTTTTKTGKTTKKKLKATTETHKMTTEMQNNQKETIKYKDSQN